MNGDASSPRHWPAIPPSKAGLGCKCPRCGIGALYKGLLTIPDSCGHCGLNLSVHDTGDGASVFVIFILGFLVVPMALWFEGAFAPQIWVHLLIWPPLIIALGLAFLRPVKAILVALHFKNLRHKYDD